MSGRPNLIGALPPAVVDEHAACKGKDQAIFFPTQGEDSTAAKAICGTCPVRDACLDFALTNREKFGIWGGMSENERRAERKARGLTGKPRRPRTHCDRGHAMAGANLYVNNKGHRRCVACHSDATKRANQDRRDRERGAA